MKKDILKKKIKMGIVGCFAIVYIIGGFEVFTCKTYIQDSEFPNVEYLYDNAEFLKENNIMSEDLRQKYTLELDYIKKDSIDGNCSKEEFMQLCSLNEQLINMAELNKKNVEAKLDQIIIDYNNVKFENDADKKIERINKYISNGNYVAANEENTALEEMLKQKH